MLEGIINHLLFFGGSLALTMALVQFVQIFRDGWRIWLCVFFLCISAIGFQQYYYGVYDVPSFEISAMRGQMVLFLLGPSIFFFYKKLFYRDFIFSIRDVIHFVPPFLSLCVDIFMYLSEASGDPSVLAIRGGIVRHTYYYTISTAIILIAYDVYILVKEDFISLFRHKMMDQVNRLVLIFIVMVLMIAILLLFTMMFFYVTLGRFVMTLMILPFLFIYLMGIVNPDVLGIITSVIRKNIYERSLISGMDMEALKSRLDDLMNMDKVFCDEDLNLKRLADMLSLTPHQLSEFLNKHLDISFNYYINRLRIDEAAYLMKCQPERSITSICYSVGFNSKSAFYEAFTKFIGISPSRYRKKSK